MTVIAVGDIALNGKYRQHHLPPWKNVPAFWQECDLRTGNLESPVTVEPRFADSKLALRAAPQAMDILAQSLFDALSVANNHAMDFGPEGLRETTERVKGIGVGVTGSGQNVADACRPCLVEKNGHRIAIFSFCDVIQISPLYATLDQPGVAPLNDKSLRMVRAISGRVDWVIVHLHWGTEMCQLPSPQQRVLARQFVEVGADAIIGHHPHVLQPMEVIDNVPVWYSLGNFAFSSEFWQGKNERGETFAAEYHLHPLARKAAVARVTLTKGKSPNCEFHPTCIRHDGKVVADADPNRLDSWRAACDRLQRISDSVAYTAEVAEASNRQRWQTSARSLYRKLRLKAFQAGILGRGLT